MDKILLCTGNKQWGTEIGAGVQKWDEGRTETKLKENLWFKFRDRTVESKKPWTINLRVFESKLWKIISYYEIIK